MAGTVAADHAGAIDRDMKRLRATMRGIQIRAAGFKKDHDNLARATARLAVALVEAEAFITSRRGPSGGQPGATPRRGGRHTRGRGRRG